MKRKIAVIFAAVCLVVIAVFAANPSFQSFLTSQFASNNSQIGIKSGANVTNLNALGITSATNIVGDLYFQPGGQFIVDVLGSGAGLTVQDASTQAGMAILAVPPTRQLYGGFDGVVALDWLREANVLLPNQSSNVASLGVTSAATVGLVLQQGAAAQTPWTQTINGNGFGVTNAGPSIFSTVSGTTSINGVTNTTVISSVAITGTNQNPSSAFAERLVDIPISTNFQVLGGLLSSVRAGAGGVMASFTNLQTGASGSRGFEGPSTPMLAFGFDGSTFLMRLAGGAYKLLVADWTGQPFFDNDVIYSIPNDGNIYDVTVTFPTYARRYIKFVAPSCMIYSVSIPKTNGWFNQLPYRMHRTIVLGDSFIEQSAAQSGAPFSGTGLRLSELYPTLDLWTLGEGGTGFTNVGISSGTNFLGRVTNDVITWVPENVIYWGGINDGVTNTNLTQAVYTNLTNVLVATRNGLPNANIYLIGPQFPRAPDPSGNSNVFNMAAVMSNACLNLISIAKTTYINPVAEPWITGTGISDTNGNGIIYTGSDGTHPTQAGAYYYASRIVQAMSPTFQSVDTNLYGNVNTVSLTNLFIPTTTVFTSPGAGIYQVSGSWITTVVPSTITNSLTLSWLDEAAITVTTNILNSNVVSTIGAASFGPMTISVGNGRSLTYATSIGGTNYAYNIRLNVRRVD